MRVNTDLKPVESLKSSRWDCFIIIYHQSLARTQSIHRNNFKEREATVNRWVPQVYWLTNQPLLLYILVSPTSPSPLDMLERLGGEAEISA